MQFSRVAFAIALAAVVGSSGCGKKTQAGPKGPPPLSVDTAVAARRDIATYLTVDGQIAPLQDATLSVQQPGPLVGVYVNEGDHVGAGQLLAKVDDSVLRAQLAQAQARAQSSALSVPMVAQQGSAAVQTARNTLATDRAALTNAQLVYNQNTQLFRQGYVSQTALEQSRAAYVAAQQRVQIDQQQVQTAMSNTGQTGVSSANAAADRAAIESLATQIRQTALYAPFAGVITQRLMDPGAMAGPQAPVLRLSQVDVVYININIPDEDLPFVHAGTPMHFATSSLAGRTFSGTISDVNAVPTQGTLSYRARVRQPNPGNLLRGGMLVSVTIQKEKHPNTIVVPRSAVAQGEKGNSVFVVRDGKAVEVPVAVGLQTDTLSEVHAPGLRPGTPVITTRPDALQNGSVVAINGAVTAPGSAPAAGGHGGRKTH